MSNELNFYGTLEQSGLTIIARIYNSSGSQLGSDVACSEAGVLAIYIGDMPTAGAGEYGVRFFSGSDLVGQGSISWDGSKESIANLDALVSSRGDATASEQASILSAVNGLNNFDPSSDVVANVTLVDTTTTNTDMRGTDGANTVVPTSVDLTPVQNVVDAILIDTDELQGNQGNWNTATGFATPADVPTTAQIESALLNEGDGQQLIDAIVQAIGNTNLSEVSLIAAIRADLERNGGMLDVLPLLSEIESSAVIAKVSDINSLNDITASDVVTAMQLVAGDFKADTTGLSTLTTAQVNSEVGTALNNYDAPTKTELDLSESNIINALDTDEMSEAELHAGLDSYANKSDWKATNTSVDLSPIQSVVDNILVDTNDLQQNQSNWLTATGFSTHSASDVWSVASRTLTSIPDATLSSSTLSAIATSVEQAILNDGDGEAVLNAIVGAIGNSNIDQVALVAAIRVDLERIGGSIDSIETKSEADVRQVSLIAEHNQTQSDISNIVVDNTPVLNAISSLNNASVADIRSAFVDTDFKDKNTEAEIHAWLNSYTNKDQWSETLTAIQIEQLEEIHQAHYNRRKHSSLTNTITIYDDDKVTPLHVFDSSEDLCDITPQ